jgi:acetate kinase
MKPNAPTLLVLNPGSSTLKHAYYVGATCVDSGSVDWLASMDHGNGPTAGPIDYATTVQQLAEIAPHPIDAVAYRVVHGGTEFRSPTVLDDAAIERIAATVDLAPLHQPPALATMRAARAKLPAALHVACFDTAFHATMPEAEKRFAIPDAYFAEGIQRYGFHGLSYESIAHSLPSHSLLAARGRTIVCHLGNGASLCGMLGLESRTTTMGFTPLDGLIMGTRCGRIDAGIVFHWLRQGKSASEIEMMLTKASGLLGISTHSSDMRHIVESRTEDPKCELALEMFCRSAAKEIASAAVVLGGVDAIVFTAGIGENSPLVRSRIIQALGWMGATLHEDANLANATMLHAPHSRIEILRIETDEQSVLARHALRCLDAVRDVEEPS